MSHKKLITFNGETLSRSEWSKRIGPSANIVTNRLHVMGWCEECAVSTPMSRFKSDKEQRESQCQRDDCNRGSERGSSTGEMDFMGKTWRHSDLSVHLFGNRYVIYRRRKRGWCEECITSTENGLYCPHREGYRYRRRGIEAFGALRTMQGWIDHNNLGISRQALGMRLNYGWTPEEAVTIKRHGRRRNASRPNTDSPTPPATDQEGSQVEPTPDLPTA